MCFNARHATVRDAMDIARANQAVNVPLKNSRLSVRFANSFAANADVVGLSQYVSVISCSSVNVGFIVASLSCSLFHVCTSTSFYISHQVPRVDLLCRAVAGM